MQNDEEPAFHNEHPVYRVSAAVLETISPLELGIPARRLLHALLWAFCCLDRRRSASVSCAEVRKVFWPSATDRRELDKGKEVLKATGIFDVLEIRGRALVYRWSDHVFPKVSAEFCEGYATLTTAQISGTSSEYRFRLIELLALNIAKKMPTFELPVGLHVAGHDLGLRWQEVRQPWLTAIGTLCGELRQRVLIGVVKHRATGAVKRVVVKLQSETSQWQPGALYAFSLRHGEHVEILKVISATHTAVTAAEARQKRMATRIT